MRLLKLVVPFLLLAACGGPEKSNRPPEDNPAAAPTVSSTLPADDGVGIAVNLPITATFSRAMDGTTLDASSFLLTDAAGAVPGVVTSAGRTATFTPATDLAHDAVITATLTTASRDEAGTALGAAYSWSFTTVAAGAAPEISAVRPLDDASDVPTTESVHATFNAAMDPATLNAASFGLSQDGTTVPGTVSYEASSNTATFVPSAPLGASLLYVATISPEAKSTEGSALAQAYSWSFSTFAGDPSPSITAVSPLDGALDIWSGEQPRVTFDQAMAPATLTTATFTVERDAIAVAGSVSYDAASRTAAFVPAMPLDTSALYTATVSDQVMSAAGQHLAEARSWSFTTRPASIPALAVNLGTAGNVVILAKSGISTVPASAITGNIGISPAAATYITGFSLIADATNMFATSPQVTGNVYAADYAPPTPPNLTTAVGDMETRVHRRRGARTRRHRARRRQTSAG